MRAPPSLPLLAALSACALLPLRGGDAAIPWAAVAPPVGAAPEAERYRLVEGGFRLDSDVADEPVVVCHWATAVDGDGRPAPRAGELVYYFHQPGHHRFIEDGFTRDLVCKSGFSLCGVVFTGPSTDVAIIDDRKRFYAYSHSGSLRTIRRAIVQVRQELRLGERPLLLYGYSAGGIGVQHLAEEYPELCAGVVSYCGHFFVQKRRAGCPFLIAHNFGDMEHSGDGVTRYYRELGTPVIPLQIEPVWAAVEQDGASGYHRLNPAIFRLARRFFEALVAAPRLAAQNPAPAWPLTLTLTAPRRLQRDAAAADGVALALPSLEVAAEIVRHPAPPAMLADGQGDAGWAIRPSELRPPVAVLLLSDATGRGAPADGSTTHARQQASDLRYAAARGLLTLAPLRATDGCGRILACVHRDDPASAALPTLGLAFFPGDAELAGLLPQVQAAVIVTAAGQSADRLSALAAALAARRLPHRIVLVADDEAAAAHARAALGGPATIHVPARGRRPADVALHQELLRTALDALEAVRRDLPDAHAP